MTRMTSALAILGGVSALGCHTPSSVSTAAGTSAPRNASVAWSAPATGRTHTLLPTPTTVAWGWYDAAAQPVRRVASGDELVLRALSTCGLRTLTNARLDTTRIQHPSHDSYAAQAPI